MAELVARLNAGGRVRTACLSNTNRAHWTLMQRGAFPAFQALQIRHASHILGVAKPSPAIYRAFEERTGRSGAEILFFDDREDNVDAARAAGWLAVVVNTLAGPAAEIARHLDRLGL